MVVNTVDEDLSLAMIVLPRCVLLERELGEEFLHVAFGSSPCDLNMLPAS